MRRRWRWTEPRRREARKEPVRERRFTLMLVPEGAGDPVRQVVFTLAHLRRAITVIAACLVVGIVGVMVGASVLPRRLSYESLLDENLALKSRLREIESKIEAVDMELRQVRYFSAQLENLPPEARPGEGPLALNEVASIAWMDEQTRAWMDLDLSPGLGLDDLESASHVFAMDDGMSELEDVRLRADRLESRLDGTLSAIRAARGRLGSQAESTEYLRTRWVAMPSDWPLDGVLTSPYGRRRSPFTRQWKFHRGLDLSAPIGSEIRAPAPGTILSAGWNSGYGRMVQVDHGYGVVSRYAHMGRVRVKKGDRVRRGDALGGVGMTGRTTGPHLHYEIQVDGRFVDPMVFLR